MAERIKRAIRELSEDEIKKRKRERFLNVSYVNERPVDTAFIARKRCTDIAGSLNSDQCAQQSATLQLSQLLDN